MSAGEGGREPAAVTSAGGIGSYRGIFPRALPRDAEGAGPSPKIGGEES